MSNQTYKEKKLSEIDKFFNLEFYQSHSEIEVNDHIKDFLSQTIDEILSCVPQNETNDTVLNSWLFWFRDEFFNNLDKK